MVQTLQFPAYVLRMIFISISPLYSLARTFESNLLAFSQSDPDSSPRLRFFPSGEVGWLLEPDIQHLS